MRSHSHVSGIAFNSTRERIPFWLNDGAGVGLLDSTSMTALGLRVMKGFHENVAFEAEFAGGRTGEAYFGGVLWGNMSGDIRRRASFGRMLGAGVLRFGHKYVSFMRMGAGVQGTVYDSSFITGGNTMNGPGSEFEIDMFVTIGAGLDIHLGRHWSVGAAASFDKLVSSDARSVGAGVYVGYGGNP